MKTIKFSEFREDYKKYYNENINPIRTQDELDEIIYDLYDTDELNFEIDYENKIISLY